MGLLDQIFAQPSDNSQGGLLYNPMFRLGMNLLSRSGPQKGPHNFGQDFAGATQDLQAQQGDDQAQAMKRLQMQMMQDQVARQKQQDEMGQAVMTQLMGINPAAPPEQAGVPDALAKPRGGMPAPPPSAAEIAPPPSAAPPQAPQSPFPNGLSGSGLYGQGSQVAPPKMPAPSGQQDFGSMIEDAARQAGIDPQVFRSLVNVESGGRHIDPATQKIITSKAGALGLAQLMPATAKGLGVDPNDPAQNLRGGATYLAQMLKKFGNMRDALRAYNAGPGNVSMSPTISTGYADKVLAGVQGGGAPPANQVADASGQATPAPAAPDQSAPPQSGVLSAFMKLPPDVQQNLKMGAFLESNGDPAAFMKSLGQSITQYTQGQATYERSHPPLSDDAIQVALQTWAGGDPSLLQGYGRDPASRVRLANAMPEFLRAKGMNEKDIIAAKAALKGDMSGLSSLGTRIANIDTAAQEVTQFANLTRDNSRRVDRGKFVPLTQLLQMKDSAISDPNLGALKTNLLALANAAAVVAGRGTTNEHLQDHFREILSSADGPEALEAKIQQVEKEAAAVRQSSRDVRTEFINNVRGGSETSLPDTTKPPATMPSGGLARPKTPAEAQALPPGTHFIDPNGVERVR